MNNRFDFRIWDEENNKWFYFNFHNYPMYQDKIWKFLTDGEKIYQCSDTQDKNLKFVFEGDIVKRQNRYIGMVVFDKGCFKIKWKDGIYYGYPRHIDDYQESSLEIIGDIIKIQN